MGFYHPSTLVKDAQRRGVRFHPIDVQISGLGLHGRSRRRDPARPALCERPARAGRPRDRQRAAVEPQLRSLAPCSRSAIPMLSQMRLRRSSRCSSAMDAARWFCNNCSHDWTAARSRAPASLPFARRSRRAHRPAPRRAGHARRHRRAQRVRLRPPLRAVAGRARGPAVRRVVRRRSNRRARRDSQRSRSKTRVSASSAESPRRLSDATRPPVR